MTRGRKMFVGLTALLVALLLSACGAGTGGGADTTKPVITLLGRATVALSVGDTYTDAGATATDDTDGNITDKIVVNNPVDTGVAGTYTVTYDVNDSAGNAADQVTRTVTVSAVTPPTPNQSPIANAGADLADYPGNPITLDGSGSSDPDGTIASYAWKEGAATLSTSESFVKSDFTSGEHTVTLTVTDDDGATASDSVTVVIYEKLKKTGQTKIYDANGTECTHAEADGNASLRDDGYYQKGVDPNYTRDDTKAIVTDTVTGLQWQDDVNITKPWLTQENYDKCTGRNGQTQDTSKCTDTSGDTAATYCTNLTLGDYTDWRLPTIKELMYIADRSRRNPAIDPTFQNARTDVYWSSTSIVGDEGHAWYVIFDDDGDYNDAKSVAYYVRCVRAGE